MLDLHQGLVQMTMSGSSERGLWCPLKVQNCCGTAPIPWNSVRILFVRAQWYAHTKFEIAALNNTNNASSCAVLSMLWTPEWMIQYIVPVQTKAIPSKSSATSKQSSVGATDIHTPSVVRIADPANDVSTRWLSAKLFPTDCSPGWSIMPSIYIQGGYGNSLPIEETTLTC